MLASDAFFPFSWNDSVEIACKAGVAAIVHPGGSVRDADAVECCNKVGGAGADEGVWGTAVPAGPTAVCPAPVAACGGLPALPLPPSPNCCAAPAPSALPPNSLQYGVVLLTTGVRHFKH